MNAFTHSWNSSKFFFFKCPSPQNQLSLVFCFAQLSHVHIERAKSLFFEKFVSKESVWVVCILSWCWTRQVCCAYIYNLRLIESTYTHNSHNIFHYVTCLCTIPELLELNSNLNSTWDLSYCYYPIRAQLYWALGDEDYYYYCRSLLDGHRDAHTGGRTWCRSCTRIRKMFD